MTGKIILRKSCLATDMKHLYLQHKYDYLQGIHSCFYRLYTAFFQMEAKLLEVESVVGGSSLPPILTEPEHLKHIDALINLQEQYRAKATQNILCAQTMQTEATL